ADADKKPAAYALPKMLAQPGDLAKLTPGKDVVVLDARSRDAYDAGHVPGAVWVHVEAWSKAAAAMEGRDKWAERVGKLGIDGSVPVIVYGASHPQSAARVWWILQHWGLEDVR